MMQKLSFFILLFFTIHFSIAQQHQLSETATVSVLTVGPGNHLNDAFGHSGFRIKDRLTGLDVVYGYGEYDFDTPNFYLKFAQGKLNYLISKTEYNRFYQVYSYYDRSIREQVLNLTQAEKQKLYDYLINNYKPENRGYLYDFFFDNCATKIKDVTNIAVNNRIEFHEPKDFENASFRTLIQNELNRNSWGSLSIDICLGSVIDRQAPAEDHMFLPKNIYKFFENATIGKNKPLVSSSRTLYSQQQPPAKNNFLTSPLFILGIIACFIIFITFKDFKNQQQSKWLDVLIFAITGVIGVLILLLWFATDHKGTHQNYNLLWAFALNLFVIGQFFKAKPAAWFVKYLKLLIILLCLLTLHWIIGVQVFAIGLIPILIALMLRYVFLVSNYNR
ncbi:lipoprotein N-acyltransferase Lnb domain-containing protein [Pseudotamlana agarivorans]|uniref:lipoprotein N-acyltransferase Lnb domain-containing protein n=1 Tax=Pseudotamlana agarivorans TaxID=481183 RepID=UPI00082D47A8|nr:DUF4105 domain-containing protein [Tamlana agarivorans]